MPWCQICVKFVGDTMKYRPSRVKVVVADKVINICDECFLRWKERCNEDG